MDHCASDITLQVKTEAVCLSTGNRHRLFRKIDLAPTSLWERLIETSETECRREIRRVGSARTSGIIFYRCFRS